MTGVGSTGVSQCVSLVFFTIEAPHYNLQGITSEALVLGQGSVFNVFLEFLPRCSRFQSTYDLHLDHSYVSIEFLKPALMRTRWIMKGRPSATLAKVQINQNIEVMSGGGRGVCNTHRHHHHPHRHHYDDDHHQEGSI